MRFSPGLKVSILPLLFIIVTIMGTLVGMAVVRGNMAHASVSSFGFIPTFPMSLRIGATSYSTTDPIKITLDNASTSTIYFPDHLTNCTVTLLQHQSYGRWETVNPCLLAIVTRLHSLAPGKSLTVQLVPSSTHPWMAGLYRATLSYRTSSTTGPSPRLFSRIFQVS